MGRVRDTARRPARRAAYRTPCGADLSTDYADTRVRRIGANVMITMGTITVYREYGIPPVGRRRSFVDGSFGPGLRSNSAVDITAG
jgi:hypothetical protein